MPQPSGLFSGQRGAGIALVFAAETVAFAEACEAVAVEATKPVRAKTTTKLRTIIFMVELPLGTAQPG
jgi:hypothetical protein